MSENYAFHFSDMAENPQDLFGQKTNSEIARMNKTFGYARVSTKEQHLDRQIQALREAGVEERDIITDKASGASLDRPGYQTLKNSMLREGDTLVIKSLDRLSRNKEHITQELRYFKEHHIQVRVLDLPTTMIELPEGQEWVFQMINNILIEVLSSIAEQGAGYHPSAPGRGNRCCQSAGENTWAGLKRRSPQIGRRYSPVGKQVKSLRWRR